MESTTTRDESKLSTSAYGKRFAITNGTGRQREWCVACLDILICCVSPKGESVFYNVFLLWTFENESRKFYCGTCCLFFTESKYILDIRLAFLKYKILHTLK